MKNVHNQNLVPSILLLRNIGLQLAQRDPRSGCGLGSSLRFRRLDMTHFHAHLPPRSHTHTHTRTYLHTYTPLRANIHRNPYQQGPAETTNHSNQLYKKEKSLWDGQLARNHSQWFQVCDLTNYLPRLLALTDATYCNKQMTQCQSIVCHTGNEKKKGIKTCNLDRRQGTIATDGTDITNRQHANMKTIWCRHTDSTGDREMTQDKPTQNLDKVPE